MWINNKVLIDMAQDLMMHRKNWFEGRPTRGGIKRDGRYKDTRKPTSFCNYLEQKKIIFSIQTTETQWTLTFKRMVLEMGDGHPSPFLDRPGPASVTFANVQNMPELSKIDKKQ